MKHKITLQQSGRDFVAEDNETILAAALRQGVIVPYNCRNGICGTCKANLIEGKVDYGQYEERALNENERAQGKVLLCQAKALSDVVVGARELAAAAGIEIKTLPCRVVKLDKLAPDVMNLHLALPQSQAFNFLPGQYIDFLLADNRRRSFSMANAPDDTSVIELHVRHVPDGYFTNHVFEKLQEKALLRFQGPLGSFFLREESDKPIIMIAGGTGFAPMKSIIEHAFKKGVTRPIKLYWGARARIDLYLNDLPAQWASEYENFSYVPVLSEPEEGDSWSGRTGWVHDAVVEDHADFSDFSDFEVYMSGPPPMIDAAKKEFFVRGLNEDDLYYESFDLAHEIEHNS